MYFLQRYEYLPIILYFCLKIYALFLNLSLFWKWRVSLVSSVMSVIKDFEFGEWIFFHYIIIKYILL